MRYAKLYFRRNPNSLQLILLLHIDTDSQKALCLAAWLPSASYLYMHELARPLSRFRGVQLNRLIRCG